MSTPITVTFPKTKASPWLEAEIHGRVERLKVVCSDLISCRVVVDIPHRRHQRGNRFSLRIDLAVPGEDLAITRDANMHGTAKDLDERTWTKRFDVEAARRDIRLVLGDGFAAARRRLRDYAQVRRRDVKRHEPPVRGFAVGSEPRRATRTRRTRATVPSQAAT